MPITLTAVTDGIRHTLYQAKQLPPHKVLFLPNGVDTQLFRPTVPEATAEKKSRARR